MDNKFTIDFFELSFLAEACIPTRPIARTVFWQNLSKRYYNQMSKDERARLFEWMNRNDHYKESLTKHQDTKDFHCRFDPDNQYLVSTLYKGKKEVIEAYKQDGKYCTQPNTSIIEEYIKDIKKAN